MFANFLYAIALGLASPVILYRAIRHHRYRRGVGEKLFGLSALKCQRWQSSSGCIWFHAVSVGEVNLLPGVIRELKRQRPDHRPIVISASTDTGYDLAVKHFGSDRVFFCPLDFTWAVKRTLRNLKPAKLVLVELELWPNLIRQANRHHCEVMVINARLSGRSAGRYKKASRLTRPIFSALHWVGCQDEACRSRFESCGTPADRLMVTGSLKFDDAPSSRERVEVESCIEWARIDPWHRVWLFGSTQSGEETMALDIYRALTTEHPDLRLILVPRHRERFDEVGRLIEDAGFQVRRRSREDGLKSESWEAHQVILVDTIGELRNWWGTAQIATVGGSFGNRGGQNMLEPAGYGCAVSFGPDTRNFREIAEALIAGGGAVRVQDARELEQFVRRCLDDVPSADALGRAAQKVVEHNRGATARTIKALIERRGSGARGQEGSGAVRQWGSGTHAA
jgi:3-deoxy-D-manno-octulosonic-acid transferase